MKPPISYYGGKQQLSSIILKLIPQHKIYCEPFFGGGAIFFGKEPSPVEIVNDVNSELINFYEVIRDDFDSLAHEISLSLHSRASHRHAWVIYENPDMFDRVKRAWAIWFLATVSFGHAFNGGYGYDLSGKGNIYFDYNKQRFIDDYAKRLNRVQIENCDALRVIKSRDSEETFFYIDPPYVNSYTGHYDGYTQSDFDELLDILCNIKGKFLLSSYRNKSLESCVAKKKLA